MFKDQMIKKSMIFMETIVKNFQKMIGLTQLSFAYRIKGKAGQNTLEYAILISLVVAGIVAMQTYAQRALQARVRDASVYMSDTIAAAPTGSAIVMGGTPQYEPYYLETAYDITRDGTESEILGVDAVGRTENTTRTRRAGGNTVSTYAGPATP